MRPVNTTSNLPTVLRSRFERTMQWEGAVSAISTVYHDVDGDGELDTNFLGAPRGPLGLSRDARGRMGPPSFDAAAISIEEDDMKITVNLSD